MNHALQFISNQLNELLKNEFAVTYNMVTVGRLKNIDGTVPEKVRNQLVLTTVNLTLENDLRFTDSRMGFASRGKVAKPVPVHLNMSVLLAANFENELEGLKILRSAILFLRTNTFFTQATSPSLSEDIHKIELESRALSLAEVNSMWSALGCSATPSMLYTVRVTELSS